MSAFGGKADIPSTTMSVHDPKQTSGIVNAMSFNSDYFRSIRSQFARRGKTDCLLALVTQGVEVFFDAR